MGLSHPEIARDGDGRDTGSTVLHGMGLSHHGIARDNLDGTRYTRYSRDGIGTSRDCTGRGKHGTPQDGILYDASNTVHYGTGLSHHGIARDGITPTRTYTVF